MSMSQPAPVRLSEIQERLDAATPRPWRSDGKIVGWWGGECPAVRVAHQTEGDRTTGYGVWSPVCMVEPSTGRPLCDADFIAHAPSDIASLLTLTRALRDALKPFAAWADSCTHNDPDDMLLGSGVNKDGSANTVGDLRRARALLEQIQE